MSKVKFYLRIASKFEHNYNYDFRLFFNGIGKYIEMVGHFKIFDTKYNYSWWWWTDMTYYANVHLKVERFYTALFHIKATDNGFLNSKFKHAMAEWWTFPEIQGMQMHFKRQTDKALKTIYLLQTNYMNTANEKRL